MIITTPEGFKIQILRDASKEFLIDSERIEECLDYIRENDLRQIGINSFLGYKAHDLDFLENVKDFVEGISIPESHFDISVLNQLHRLIRLGFADDKSSVIDLTNFPDLKSLACEFGPRLVSLETCEELSHLSLSNFKTSEGDLTGLPKLFSLEELNLFVTNIISLNGIQNFQNLRTLTIYKANRLEIIEDLRNIKHTVKEIEFDTCKKIQNYEVLPELEGLKRLIITNSSAIDSLDFVRTLYGLEFLSFVGTNVKSGDLSPCQNLRYVGFDDRNHYSHKFKDFQKNNYSISDS